MPARKSANGAADALLGRRAVLAGAGATLPALLSGCLEGQDRFASAERDESSESDERSDSDNRGSDDGASDIGSPAQPIDTTVSEPAETTVVSMVGDHGLRFAPQLVWIAVGGRVTWRNNDTEHSHDAVTISGAIPDDAEGFSTGTLRPGETYSRSFPVPGVYDYVCTPHASRMVGRVVVGEFDRDAEPALRFDRSGLSGNEAQAVLAALDEKLVERMDQSDSTDCDCPD